MATGQDKHSIVVDWTGFVNAQAPSEVSDPERLHSWGTTSAGVTNPILIDLRLKVTSPAIDTGVFIPNVTDDFTGKAPDLGAYSMASLCRSTARGGCRRLESTGKSPLQSKERPGRQSSGCD